MDSYDGDSDNSPKVTSTIYIKHSIRELAQRNGLSLSDATRFGIQFMLAENFLVDYPTNNLSKKLADTLKLLEEKSFELDDIKTKYKIEDKQEETTEEREPEEVLEELEEFVEGEEEDEDGN